MKISIIIPTYKPQEYLWTCLNSLVNQTFSKEDFEVILVLNGCTDPWKGEIENYIRTMMHGININFIHTEIGGVSNARNLALDVALGDYITFIDDDDYVSPKYLEELYKNASKGVVSLCFPLSFVDGSSKTENYYITKDYLKYYNKGKIEYYYPIRFFAGPVYKLIHRDIIGSRRFNTSFSKGEDSLFMFLISDSLSYVSFTSKDAVYFRRFRLDSVTMRKTSIFEIVSYRLKMIKEYSRIYCHNRGNYNFRFYISFILSSLKAIVVESISSLRSISK